MEIKKLPELIVLNKAILYIKFTSNDEESTFLSNSPFLNNLFDSVQKEMVQNHGLKIDIGKKRLLRDSKHIEELIISKTKNLHDWENLDLGVKKESLRTMAYPYIIDEEHIEQILGS
ncbi:hypothetical protein [Roseivirga sp. E12]|uniref:hypothetical protein n=1 Tax=Roseivirga sp. E12 TaxID=2819237 RepID=UPI001ABC428C|nr:hypothetical protein [Roseivirga sp. E12]MBO3699519.1 hypothetical protein [Roseivirga sp. E12]